MGESTRTVWDFGGIESDTSVSNRNEKYIGNVRRCYIREHAQSPLEGQCQQVDEGWKRERKVLYTRSCYASES